MIAYIRKMSVEEKKWLDDETFRDGIALCQSIPGATAIQSSAQEVSYRYLFYKIKRLKVKTFNLFFFFSYNR